MDRNTVISFIVGLAAGAIGYKFIGSGMAGARMRGPRRLGVQEYVGLTDWDTEQRALALTRSLEGVVRLGDVPSTFYGGDEYPPSFEGPPDFLYSYDPDGPKYPEFGGPMFRGPMYTPPGGPR